MNARYVRLQAALAALLVPASLAASASAGDDQRLIDAVRRQDRAAVQTLLRERIDINARQGDAATALHWAVHHDNAEIVSLLVRAGADAAAANDLGITPLMLACANGSLPVVRTLLDAGADPNAGPAGRETPLMAASRTGRADVVTLLLDRGANVNATETSRQQSALMWAASERHPDVVRVLIARGADVHARTVSNVGNRRGPGSRAGATVAGYTPLLFAARVGDARSAALLLDAGAKVDVASDDGLSALARATVRGHTAAAIALLERGANPNVSTPGFSPLHWAAGSWETTLTATDISVDREGNEEWNVLAGIRTGKPELVKALLARGADVNARMKSAPTRAGASRNTLPELAGATPFLLAATAGDTGVMRLLAEAGADTALTAEGRSTPLMAAAGFGRILGENTRRESQLLGAARLAVELGADVNATDAAGNTAMHYAAYHRLTSVVQFLVDKGAKIDVKNKFGETPLWTSELAIQFFGGGTFQVLRSSTGDLLRKLGAVDVRPSYERARPRDWPDNLLEGGT